MTLGISLLSVETFESFRGELAGWLLLTFGLVYFVWGVRRALRHRPRVPRLKTPATAGADERDRIMQMLLPMLEAGGFILPTNKDSQIRKLRRWVGRLRLAPKDARTFQGMLRQIQWKLDNP